MGASLADSLVVVNGPEDGTAHALIRTRLSIGSSRSCDIVIARDDDVEDRHAEAFITLRGYRIRRVHGGVRLNGNRAARLGSRLLRDGDIVQIGNTELMMRSLDGTHFLDHFGDGGSESKFVSGAYLKYAFALVIGIISTAGYAAADAVHLVLRAATGLFGALLRNRRLMIRSGMFAAAIAAYVYLPGIRRVVDAALSAAAQFLFLAADAIANLAR